MFCRNEQFGIDHGTVEYDAPVQMRAGGAPGLSGKPDALPFFNCVAGFHVDPVEVAVHGDQAVAMIDKDGLAVEKIIIDSQYPALRARLDQCAAIYRYIDTGMG